MFLVFTLYLYKVEIFPDKTVHFSQPLGKKVSCGSHLMGDQTGPAPLDTNEERLDITEIINHPDYYHDITLDNDIAVIKVNGTFTCGQNTKINPACLPNTEVKIIIHHSDLLLDFVHCRVTPMLVGKIPWSLAGEH